MRLLVFDTALGMIAGAAAYRMKGEGRVLAVYHGQQPHFQLVRALNVTETQGRIVQPIPSNEVVPAADFVEKFGFLDLDDSSSDNFGPQIDKAAKDKANKDKRLAKANAASESNSESVNNDSKNSNNNNSNKRSRGGQSDFDDSTMPWNASGRHTKDIMRVRRLLREVSLKY
jgi:hypothetical protein